MDEITELEEIKELCLNLFKRVQKLIKERKELKESETCISCGEETPELFMDLYCGRCAQIVEDSN